MRIECRLLVGRARGQGPLRMVNVHPSIYSCTLRFTRGDLALQRHMVPRSTRKPRSGNELRVNAGRRTRRQGPAPSRLAQTGPGAPSGEPRAPPGLPRPASRSGAVVLGAPPTAETRGPVRTHTPAKPPNVVHGLPRKTCGVLRCRRAGPCADRSEDGLVDGYPLERVDAQAAPVQQPPF